MGDLSDLNLDTRGTFDPTLGFGETGNKTDTKPVPKPRVKPSSSQSSENYKIPIIIVPSGISSLITQFNCVEFLQNGQYVNSLDKREEKQKESHITFSREKNDKNLKFQVVDNPVKLNKDEWNRVVAVFAQGNTWQFKNWEWKTPVEIFAKVPGFHLCWEDELPSESIRKWNVTLLAISRQESKKHLVQTAQLLFWRQIDDFLKKKKRNLFAPDYYT